MSKMERHYGFMQGGRLKASTLAATVKSYPEGTPLEFTVKQANNRKTVDQNAYLHVLFTIASKALQELTGKNYTKEMVKAYAKVEGLYPAQDFVNPKTGEVRQIPIDTRDLTKEEAMITIDRVLMHFAEMGIVLPSPGEQQSMELAA